MPKTSLTPEERRKLAWDMRVWRVMEKARERAAQIREGERYVDRLKRREMAGSALGLSVSGRVFILRGADGCTYDCTNNSGMSTHGYPLGTAVYERVGDALMLVK